MPALSWNNFNPGITSSELSQQWSNPSDVFSVLLILGGDVVARALAQLAGSRVTPVAFSFGWVAYAVAAVVNIFGENRLMPIADCACKVINGYNGYARDNSSWVIGRIVRDFESWMDDGQLDGPIRKKVEEIIEDKRKITGPPKPPMAGLCVSVYKAKESQPGHPGYDWVYYAGFATVIVQLALAAVPCGLYGNWAILLVTVAGIILSFATGALPQWTEEKWACGRNSKKITILTRGNGTQHAILIIGDGKGLDLEHLAASSSISFESRLTKSTILMLAVLWILLLINAAGIQENTWYLLAIGGIGMLDNILAAGATRTPDDFGIPLEYVEVIGHHKVMQVLFEVEKRYPRVGKSMLALFFPGPLRKDEVTKWDEFDRQANAPKKGKEEGTEGNEKRIGGKEEKDEGKEAIITKKGAVAG
ncbi:uncharacterized protein F4807DRAFT_465082 [Annulohypoxylon truncatum]|uniref:uncharacterized protein n=1 Tax=Annulohypoxylon truncatum TaxID=327061 RepID=UPI00200790BB|nr:uncharacterized protein F4807DRAFT_465082 [Annulohypoxylon truncatum]KAI1204976.1 hypothetical protein F4807DRAFT_465082 [Annulohypoxylon truncatum]